jgi:hypothetical protein
MDWASVIILSSGVAVLVWFAYLAYHDSQKR